MGSRKWDIFDEQLTSIPGASSLHPAVMRAMQRPYVNPWAEEFILYLNETLDLLKIIYNTKQDVLIMMGPIRLAMDAVVCSLLELGCKTAGILVNGYWSQLFSEIMENHGIFPIVISEEWGLPLDPEKAFRVGPTGLLQIRREVTLHMLTCIGLAFKQLGHDINLERSLCVADSELGNL